jgi:L-alanine-DL-glutamate epimerase-like enolase superfamily enzyme
MKQVFAESVLPVIADESCILEADVQRCKGFFHGVNVKLTKCGGQTPARRMLANARELGLKTMVGCMTETSVGISAIAQLLPMLDYVDMDGALLLAGDVADGVTIDKGVVSFPVAPGSHGNAITWRGVDLG